MITLPNENYRNHLNEKIATYQFLAEMHCPVFKSILLDENEKLTKKKLDVVKNTLNSNYCTVRYQYIKACTNPIKGGNKVPITIKDLSAKNVYGTQMWLLQPIDRTKNIYGINIHVNRKSESLIIECVGKGFDVSDLNMGNVSPHERICFNYPIEYGWQNEWWKFIKLEIVSEQEFQNDKIVRVNKLKSFGLILNDKIFDNEFQPLPYHLVESLIEYIQIIDDNWDKSDEYIVSISMNIDGKLVFWDIQTPNGKMRILKNS